MFLIPVNKANAGKNGGYPGCSWREYYSGQFVKWQHVNITISGLPSNDYSIGSFNFYGTLINSSMCPGNNDFIQDAAYSTTVQMAWDVWGARRAGLWTSSFSIRIAGKTRNTARSINFRVYTQLNGSTYGFDNTYAKWLQSDPNLSSCAQLAYLIAITVNDDGSISVS